MLDQGRQLRAAGPSHQAQMGGYDPQLDPADIGINHHGTTRFGTGQIDMLHIYDVGTRRQQHRVAMPADTNLAGHGHRNQTCFSGQHVHWQGRRAGTKAPVGLLEDNNLGIQIADDAHDTFGVALAIRTFGFAHIVAGDAKRWLGHRIGAPMRKTPSARRRGK
jgi:hypothetical protein